MNSDHAAILLPKAAPKPRDQSLRKARSAIYDAAVKIITQILEWPLVDMRRHVESTRKDWLKPPPLSSFKRLEPIGFGLEQDDVWWFHPDDCEPNLVWPLNVAFASDEAPRTDLVLHMFRTVAPREARGYVNRFGPYMVRTDVAQVMDNEMVTAAGVWVWLGGKWSDADGARHWLGRTAEQATPEALYIPPASDGDIVSMAISIALRQRYEWAVALGTDESPSIRFATDPTGIKDIFRIRDLPEGRDRRAALLTWISEHWRQTRYDPDVELYVRRHLRGAHSFQWRGLVGEVLASQYDLEQQERFTAERQAMRAAGTDRRPRVERRDG